MPALSDQEKTAAAQYERDGFFIAPPVIPAELLARVRPRVSFAIHLRTEKSGLRPGTRWQDAGYLHDFNDPVGSPVIHRA